MTVSNKSKFLEAKYFVLKEKIRDRLVSIVGVYCWGSNEPNDSRSVALAPKAFREHVRNMGLVNLPYYLGHHYSNDFVILILSYIYIY